tara:strand:- start:7341 stop:8255 length:915 start_codon:yes stop_codon:yes gene_type:complete
MKEKPMPLREEWENRCYKDWLPISKICKSDLEGLSMDDKLAIRIAFLTDKTWISKNRPHCGFSKKNEHYTWDLGCQYASWNNAQKKMFNHFSPELTLREELILDQMGMMENYGLNKVVTTLYCQKGEGFQEFIRDPNPPPKDMDNKELLSEALSNRYKPLRLDLREHLMNRLIKIFERKYKDDPNELRQYFNTPTAIREVSLADEVEGNIYFHYDSEEQSQSGCPIKLGRLYLEGIASTAYYHLTRDIIPLQKPYFGGICAIIDEKDIPEGFTFQGDQFIYASFNTEESNMRQQFKEYIDNNTN